VELSMPRCDFSISVRPWARRLGRVHVTGYGYYKRQSHRLTWNLGGLVLPTNGIFTISEANVASGLDLDLPVRAPQRSASSSNQFYIVSLIGPPIPRPRKAITGQLFFFLDASPVSVPEPATLLLTLLALSVITQARKWLR